MTKLQCVAPENIHTPPNRRDWKFLDGGGVLKGPKISVNVWSLTGISTGVGGLRKIPSVGEVWIPFGTTQCTIKPI